MKKEKNKKSFFAFNWVLINELAIGSVPLNLEHLNKLSENKIQSILSLCSIEEAKIPEEMDKLFLTKKILIPDHKYGRLPSLEELDNVLMELESLMSNGPVFVHCFASCERSPLVCLGWLVKKTKLKPQQALDYLMQVHPYTNPLPQQLALISQLVENKI